MISAEELINKALVHNPKADIDLIRKAYELAKEAHEGQKRDSGEPFVEHCIETAKNLVEMNLDSTTVAAGLLHDVLEDTNVKAETIKKEFGKTVLDLVEGVTKIRRIEIGETEERKAATVRKVLLATSKDIRVIFVKLADRLHNMRTLKHLSEKRQKKIAQEALDIYAPIAHKLGMHKIKSELEDLSLRYLKPDVYQELKTKVSEKKEERERRVNNILDMIKGKLVQAKVPFIKVYGRIKTFHSINKKITKRGYKFEDIRDLIAIRILTKATEDCYRALGVLHSNWTYLPNKFKDYIANPKPNGYQTIHTAILFDKKAVEVQIRTEDMHIEAEEGIAAHWRYKGTERDKKFDRKIAWLRQFLDWQRTSESAKDLIETVKIDLFKDEIIVFTPKGDPISLPEESTPIDFAYEIHSGIGDKCIRSKVNNILVPLSHPLKSGDIVEIMTQNNAKPSRHWLTFARTTHAKSKIRQALGIQLDDKKVKKHDEASRKGLEEKIVIKNEKYSTIKFSRCCNVQEGSQIVGFKTKDGKITIHSKECPNLDAMQNLKSVNVNWKESKKEIIKELVVTVKDRVGLLADLLNLISDFGINIKSLNTKPKKQHIQINMGLDIKSEESLKLLLNHIKSIHSVIGVNLKD